MKKLVLTGILAWFLPGSLSQILFAIAITFALLMLQVIVSPMKTPGDNLLSFLAAVMLLAFFIGAYACQATAIIERAEGVADETSWLIFVLLIGATLVVFLSTAVSFFLKVRELRAKAAAEMRLYPDGVTPPNVHLLPAPNAI